MINAVVKERFQRVLRLSKRTFDRSRYLKLALLGAALLNAALFHRAPFRSVANWNLDLPAPGAARAAAVISLVLWVAVIACGRLLAYL